MVTRCGRPSEATRSKIDDSRSSSRSRPIIGARRPGTPRSPPCSSPTSSSAVIVWPFPLSWSGPRFRNVNPRAAFAVRSATTTCPGSAACSSRAATFTASPVTMPSPGLGVGCASTSPELIPIRTSSVTPRVKVRSSFNACRRRRILSAARNARAALRMRRRLHALNDDLTLTHGVTLEVRIGINSGEVLAQPTPRPGEGMVTGDAVNVAARLEQAAEPGQVVVSERTAKAARGFIFRDLGSLQLKGKGQVITALQLVGDEQGGERGVPGLRAPRVGRDRALHLLSSIYDRVASEGRPHLVTIHGDAGVGKSRLTAEFVDAAGERSPSTSVVRGRCLPYGEGVTYWPLAEILKGYAGVLDSDPPQVALEKLRAAGTDALTADRSTDPARTSAALAYTLGLEDPEFRFSELPPRQVRLETHTAWRVFFSVLGSREPTIVVIEDIHWADNALLDLLEELADRVQASVLFVCPARPELTQRRPTWGGGKRSFSSIFLDPLSPDEADQLV